MVRSISSANHRCPRNSRSLCGKLDLTLWCPLGAAHRPRRKFWIGSVLRDVEIIEDQQDQNYSTSSIIRWNAGAVQQGILATYFQGYWWASRGLWPLYSWHTDLQFMRTHLSYTNQSNIWPWIKIAIWFRI